VTTTRLEDPALEDPALPALAALAALAGRAAPGRRHVLSDGHDVAWAAIALADGGVGHLRPILAEHGFGLVLGPHARHRLFQRRYDEGGDA